MSSPMDCSTPGFPVLHCLLVFAQTHVHWAGDTIQPSHPLSPPSFGKISIQFLCLYFNWIVFLLLSCKNYLYILDSIPLPGIWFINIFSCFVICPFIFLMVSFGKIILIYFLFWLYFGVISNIQGHKNLIVCFLLEYCNFGA